MLWNIENGKINGIMYWSKLCEQYNSNKNISHKKLNYNVCPFGSMSGLRYDMIFRLDLTWTYRVWFDNLPNFQMSYHCSNSTNPWINILLPNFETYSKYWYCLLLVIENNSWKTNNKFELKILGFKPLVSKVWNPSERLMHVKLK